MNFKYALLVGSALATVAGTSAFAQAQSAANVNQLETVVVTAQKRIENVQAIPKQVQVVGVETLKQNNITSVNDLRKLVPSISGPGLSMRGVASNASSLGANGKVGIVLDDVPIPTRATFASNLLDIERVEVLPGPQGTLAGRNAAGGLINLVTRAPSQNEYTGRVSLLGTSDREYQAGVYVSGPISDKVAFSLSTNYARFRGLTYNVADKKWASDWNAGTRLKVRYAPDDTFSITGTAFYYTAESNAAGTVYREFLFPQTSFVSSLDARVPPRTFADLYPGLEVGPDSRSFYRPAGRDLKSFNNTVGGVLRFEKSWGEHTFTAVASALKERRPVQQDITPYDFTELNVRPEWVAHGNGAAQQRNATDYKTLELRLNNPSDAKLSYVAGFFLSDNLNEYDYVRYYLPVDWNRDFGQKSWATFANLAYTFDTGTTVRGGLRYEQDSIYYRWDFFAIGATSRRTPGGITYNFPAINPYVVSKGENRQNFVNYDLGIQQRINDDIMLYATHARANQGAIYDGEDNVVALARELSPVPSEVAKNFEGGLKSQWFNRRLTLNINAFYTTFDNYQASTTTVDNTNPNAVPVLKLNAVGEVRTKGLELSSSALLFDGFRVNVNGAYTKANVIDFPYAPCYTNQTAAFGCITAVVPGETTARAYQTNLAGNTLASVPKWSLNVGGSYRHQLVGETDFELAANMRYRSKQNTDLLGNPANFLVATTYVNASLAILRKEHRLELFVNNLFKENVETFGTGLPQGIRAPQAGVTVRTRNINRDNFRYWGLRYSGNF
jgi:iron complex outermembrane receptor protein